MKFVPGAKQFSFQMAGLMVYMAFIYVACAPVKFDKNDQIDCQGFKEKCDNVVIEGTSYQDFDYDYTVPGRAVDILIVDDNSGSMSFEQNHMSERFSSFLQALEQRSIDYRIAVTTTDISVTDPNSKIFNPPRAINQNGALQDGRLIAYSNGEYFLTPNSANKQALFDGVIKRAETLNCETFLKANPDMYVSGYQNAYQAACPSGVERGVYAINQVIKTNPNSFIRPNAHFAVVVLSDEDVMSSSYQKESFQADVEYQLAYEDMPQSVIENASKYLGGNTLSVHSIIVNPGSLKSGASADAVAKSLAGTGKVNTYSYFTGSDTACLQKQNTQTPNISGSYGYVYSLLSKMTGGIEGDICANDYGSQLYNIGANAGSHVNEIKLACVQPKDLVVTPDASNGTGASFTINADIVKFDKDLVPGSKVHLKYLCPK